MPPSLYLIRHAESAPSVSLPEPEWPLSEAGQAQALHLRDALASAGISRICSSPYKRAVDTIRPLAEAMKLEIILRDNLRERKLTNGWVDDFQALVRRAWDDFDFALPGCESSTAAQKRIVRTIDALALAHSGETIAVSSHGNVIGLYLNALDPSFSFEKWRAMRNPDVFRIVYNKDGVYHDDGFCFEPGDLTDD